MNYHFSGEEKIDSPSLIYYLDILEDNIGKAIASDPVDRGVIIGLPQAKSVSQSEEHWVWQLDYWEVGARNRKITV